MKSLMIYKKTPSRTTVIRKVYLIIVMFLTLIICLTLLIQVQRNSLIAVRAYIGGEGLWAKAQKDAIRSLERYAISGNETDYKSFRSFIQVPLGDSKARVELQKSDPDLNIAREGFLKGGNHPDDIEHMITFFLHFQNTAYMTQAIRHWTTGDQLIAELNGVAEKLHAGIDSRPDKTEASRDLLVRLEAINQKVTEQEYLFSSTLANASRWANKISSNISYALSTLFALLGAGISWPIITRIRATENALTESEGNLRIAAATFDSQESFMITDANCLILRVNKAFTESTGYTAEELVGQTPRLLKSGRHDADFYRKMWEEINRTGTWQGEIWDRRKDGEIYPKWLTISAVWGDDGIVTHYVGSHLDITERKQAEEKIRLLAFHDPLTRLPNRLLLLDRLQQALASSTRSGRQGALLFIDLDNFKIINDTIGHLIGDVLLQQVAERLASSVREGDTVARLGGDEFVVMLEDLSEQTIEAAEQTEAVGRKILAKLGQPYQLDAHEVHSSASIGATVFSGDHQRAEELLKQADIAMYQAKKVARSTLRFFDHKMQDSINTRAELEGELHKALDNQQFQLYYQIQVDNACRALGAEALIRWIHPDRGLVSPAQFIPLAEESGLILPIGKWVLNTACAQIKAWAHDEQTRNLVLAVNISAQQFRQTDFVDQVRASIECHTVDPNLLKLELTESILLEDIEEAIATMNALKSLGVRLSLDDFGTGYSSLQYLKLLPLNQIKIDQSFVRDIASDPNDAAIVQTIIAMTQALGLDVIAEGVETEEQSEFLDLRGCHAFQGYLFGKPAPIEQFEALLKRG